MAVKSKERSQKKPSSVNFIVKSLSGIPDGVEHEVWFHGLLPREDITLLLKEKGQFLVRQTEPMQGQGLKAVLSVFWLGKARHFIINKTSDGKVCIGKERFDNVDDLVRFHQTRKVPLTEGSGALLVTPVPKQDWELHHDQIQLGSLLGEGAFGGVYEGYMTLANGDRIKVAAKVHKGKEMSKTAIKEICKEARIMRRYEHKNIVKFHGVAIAMEPIMLIMELVDGGALDKYLEKKGAEISAIKKLNMCCDASCGLEYLHKNECIHRDLAARNCLLSNEIVKISDFGLSREMADREARYKIKDLKQRLPIRWLAPETLKDGSYSTKTDVYSFGVLMWEIFKNGAIPYAEMTVQEVNVYVKKGNRLPAPDMMPMVARDVMLKKCFSENPDKRVTMTEIRRSLEKTCRRSSSANKSKYDKSSKDFGLSKESKSVWENKMTPDISTN
ncbi:unnamed protein product, partial [Mesorhabditis belari]|uniref:Tyrosine-protein kinase n=1 Tax=Mesorhabditis belari TaxID=2138241 RepID=A0AAF3ELF4_9BILA